jgi:hypothetical protein
MPRAEARAGALIAAHLAMWRFAGEVAENAAKPLKTGLPVPLSAHR